MISILVTARAIDGRAIRYKLTYLIAPLEFMLAALKSAFYQI